MILDIKIGDQTTTYDLDALAAQHSGIVNIGRQCREVWNTIAIDNESVDKFQCNIVGAAGVWRLTHGQERTECPKGLMSNRLVPCNGCMGRCVNLRAGRPKYYQRNPETPTLLNGAPLDKYGQTLEEGDVIKCGDVVIEVR